jgi:hypothetical protein
MLIYARHFFGSLIFAVAVETLCLIFIARKIYRLPKSQLKLKKIIFAGLFASFATLPYVWYIFPILVYRSARLVAFSSEIFAVLAEALFYSLVFSWSYRKALLASALCNLVSFGLGELLGGFLFT